MKAIHNNGEGGSFNDRVVTNPKVTEYESNSQPEAVHLCELNSCY